MYEKFYGFTRKPFSISPDPTFFFQNAKYNEAYALLQYGLKERRGIFCLFGEVGTGKTMLLQKLMQSLDDSVTAITLPYPNVGFDDVLEHILTELSIAVESPKVTVRLSHLHAKLSFENSIGRTVALLVDEAQGMDPSSLENLRLLSNLETPQEKLLQIILLGQPELRDKLNLPSLRQFKQRVAINFELTPLLPDETPQYIAHRLRIAGYSQGLRLFTERALTLITNYSRGIPRLVNALCDNALLIGCVLKQREIDEKIIREAATDLMLETMRVPAPHSNPQPTAAAPVTVPIPRAQPVPAQQQPVPPPQPPPVAQYAPAPQPAFPEIVPELQTLAHAMRTPQRSRNTFRWVAYGAIAMVCLSVFIIKMLARPDLYEGVSGLVPSGKVQVGSPAPANQPSQDHKASAFQNTLVHATPISPPSQEAQPAPSVPQPYREPAKPVQTTLPPPVQPPVQNTVPAPVIDPPPAPVAAPVGVPSPQPSVVPPAAPAPVAAPAQVAPRTVAVAAAPVVTPASAPPIPEERKEAEPAPAPVADTNSKDSASERPIAQQAVEASVSESAAAPESIRTASVAPVVQTVSENLQSPRTASTPGTSNAELQGNAKRDLAWTVSRGETLLGIVKEVYGSTDLRVLSFIQMANPEMHNIDLIVQGQVLVLPPLSPERMVFQQNDGRYTAFVTATREFNKAREWQNQLNRLGIADLSANAVPIWLSANNRIYRLQADGFRSRDLAVAGLKAVLPLKFFDSVREEL